MSVNSRSSRSPRSLHELCSCKHECDDGERRLFHFRRRPAPNVSHIEKPDVVRGHLRLDSATCESAHVHGPPEGLSNRGARETDPNVGMMAAVVGPAHQNLAVFVALCSHARGNHRETSGRRGEGNIDVLYLHVMIVFVLLLAQLNVFVVATRKQDAARSLYIPTCLIKMH